MALGSKGGRLPPRSDVANRLLRLSEQAGDPCVKEAFLTLERDVLSNTPGPADHPRYQELLCTLEDAQTVLAQEDRQRCLQYTDRIREGILVWRQATTTKGGALMTIRGLFSPSSRREKKEAELIKKLERNVFDLEQKQLFLQTGINKLEQERTTLLEKASQEAPGSNAYLLAKTRYDTLSTKLQNDVFLFTALGNVLRTNSEYLSGLKSKRAVKGLEGYLPVSLEKMEQDLDHSNQEIEQIVEKLNEGAEIAQYASDSRHASYVGLDVDAHRSDFDESVQLIRKNRDLLKDMRGYGPTVADKQAVGDSSAPEPLFSGIPDGVNGNKEEVSP